MKKSENWANTTPFFNISVIYKDLVSQICYYRLIIG